MRKKRKDGDKTYKRILRSACRIFADKGYWHSTVAEICKKADTNIASINYHFGDKKNLYVEAWNYSFTRSLAKYPPDGGIPEGASPEEKLCGRIKALLKRALDKKNLEFAFMYKELANPSGLLDSVMEKSIKPLRDNMAKLIRVLIGIPAPDNVVTLCQMSIISQCMGIMLGKRLHSDKSKHHIFHLDDIDQIADHITLFGLTGINEIRKNLQKKESAAS